MGTALALLLAVAASAPSPRSYTYAELVGRLTDLRALAALPAPGEQTALASSYNRASRYDAAADRYIAWGANGDGSGVVRREGSALVLADIEGPGCIWRIWSATPRQGHVRIYLDGQAAPAVDLPFAEYFLGQAEPFTRPNLVYRLNGTTEPPGFNNYTPIPFKRSCKIVADEGWGRYYQFTYSRFPAGTGVPTFTRELPEVDRAALDRADKILGASGRYPGPVDPASVEEDKRITAAPASESPLLDLKGAGAITSLRVKLDLPRDPEAQRSLLRELTLRVTWDGEKSPAIWSPLGDFFGFVGGAEPYRSFPSGLLEDGTFYAYWYMPFGAGAHVTVGNDGAQPVAMAWQIAHQPLPSVAGLGRFHAKWHRDAFLPWRLRRRLDWTLLKTQGRGRFVGTHLHGWNPRGGWWGEGDEKFFIDGEMFPSSYGTGSEDYFGYAWSSAKTFSRPFHNQILNERNRGHFDDNRWHIADAVPFQASFEGVIEKYFDNARGTIYAAEVFWYLEPGGKDPYQPAPLSERVGYWTTAGHPGPDAGP